MSAAEKETMKYNNSLKNKIKLLRKRPVHRVRIALNYLFHCRLVEPIFVIATRRSGSNLLLSYLNSVPEASFASEVLNHSMYYGLRDRFISKAAVMRHIEHSLNDCSGKVCGLKLLRIHLEDHSLTLEELKMRFPGARFILLYRRSLLEQFVSLKTAEMTNLWIWKNASEPPAPPSLRLDAGEFDAFSRNIRGFYQELFRKEWLRACSVTLSYEELVGDPQRIFREVLFPFLGLPEMSVKTPLKKQNTRDLHRMVQNFGEFVAAENAYQEYPSSQGILEYAGLS